MYASRLVCDQANSALALGPPSARAFRRRARPFASGAAKIKVTAFIDAEVVARFSQRAAQPDAAPLSAQLNQALRAAMESDLTGEDSSLKLVTEKLLHNESFLNALSQKLKAA